MREKTWRGQLHVPSSLARIPQTGDIYEDSYGLVRCVQTHSPSSPVREIWVPKEQATQGDGLTRVQGEVTTPPLRRIDVQPVRDMGSPTATVGFSRRNNATVNIRLEIAKRLTSRYGLEEHKDRYVIAPKMGVESARRLGKALIEAADAADAGNYEYSKRS